MLRGAEHVPFLSLDHDFTERVLSFTSASKAWNIPGLKCGLAITGSEQLDRVLAERWEALLAGHLGVLGSIAAFGESVPWLDAVLDQLSENRFLLSDLLGRELPEIGYSPPEASFLAWLDCRQLALGDEPSAVFLERGRVALSPGPDFGSQGTRLRAPQHGHLTGTRSRDRQPDGHSHRALTTSSGPSRRRVAPGGARHPTKPSSS